MTSPSPATFAAAEEDDDADPLGIILRQLLPLLLAAALSVKTFVSRWRLVHGNLLQLQSLLLSESSCCCPPHPLLVHLVRSLVPELSSLLSLSRRCLDPSLPDGKLRLQSDLDIASSTLSLRLHDLRLLLLHSNSSNAIVLPLPSPAASRSDVVLFVRDAFARLQIGGLDLKLDALQSLRDLLDSDAAKIAPIFTAECHTTPLLRLLDHPVLRDRAAALIAALADSSAASRRAVFDEGGLGPLLRLLDPSLAASAAARDSAAAAVAALAADPACAWAVAAYGGVPILVGACRGDGSSSPSARARALAVAALRNLATTDDARAAMVEEGAVPALADLVVSGTPDARKNAALCLHSLASAGDDQIRSAIIHESALQRLLQSLHDNSSSSSSSSSSPSDQELQEIVLKAIQALSPHPACSRILCSSPQFFAQLADLVRRGGSVTAAALLGDLSPGDDAKRSLASCMSSLVRMMESSKPATAQETAARALACLLSVKSNRKELARDEKSVMRLVQMLDPRNEDVAKRFPVSVVLAMTAGGGSGARKRLAEAGACQALQKLADSDVAAAAAKKALQRISGNRFKNLFSVGWSN